MGFKVENSLKSQTIMLIHRVRMCARRIENVRYNSIKNQVMEYNEYPNEQKINIFGEDINFFNHSSFTLKRMLRIRLLLLLFCPLKRCS